MPGIPAPTPLLKGIAASLQFLFFRLPVIFFVLFEIVFTFIIVKLDFTL